tara:strand:+ start:232 stop:429 length:198 start_codon:yes stop_codon:yes gene_type:complete
MYNAAFLTMANLPLPKEGKPKKQMSNSLLARNVSTDTMSKEQSVNQRIAKYVSIIRKDRMDLRNG